MTEARFSSCLPAGGETTSRWNQDWIPKEAGHFGDTAPNGRTIIAQGFQAEGQLVPDLVGDNLIFRALLNKADGRCLSPGIYLFQRGSTEQKLPVRLTMGSEGGLELPQEGGLSAARGTGNHQN